MNNITNDVVAPNISSFGPGDINVANDTITHPVPGNLEFVPFDLIPVNMSYITLEWARRTFKYAYIFVKQIVKTGFENEQQLTSWMDKAKNIREELRDYGRNETVKYICRGMKERGHMLPNSTNYPTNLHDLFEIFGDVNWYKGNETIAREIIYKFCWGIFKQGNDGWIHERVRFWLDKHHLKIIYDTRHWDRYSGKNFVYTNFCKKICSMLSDNIIRTMKKSYGEYLCTRKKLEESGYIEIEGYGGKCYLKTVNQTSISTDQELEWKMDDLVSVMCKHHDLNYAMDLFQQKLSKKRNLEGKNINIFNKGKFYVFYNFLIHHFL